jgi:hypothetical protein
VPATTILERVANSLTKQQQEFLQGGGEGASSNIDCRALAGVLMDVISDPDDERVLVRYAKGSGVWDAQKTLIVLRLFLFTLDVIADGYSEGSGFELIDPAKNAPFEASTLEMFRVVWPNGVPPNCDF